MHLDVLERNRFDPDRTVESATSSPSYHDTSTRGGMTTLFANITPFHSPVKRTLFGSYGVNRLPWILIFSRESHGTGVWRRADNPLVVGRSGRDVSLPNRSHD